MEEFDYDIGKYIAYRKKEREMAKKQEIENIEIEDIIEDVKKAKEILEIRTSLSEGARRFIEDIKEGKIWEKEYLSICKTLEA